MMDPVVVTVVGNVGRWIAAHGAIGIIAAVPPLRKRKKPPQWSFAADPDHGSPEASAIIILGVKVGWQRVDIKAGIAHQLIARGKQMTTKKSASKKTAAKKSTAKKSSRKKAGSKKTTRKKATGKKTTKKAAAKKAAPKKDSGFKTPKKETKMISASGEVATSTGRTWNSPPHELFKPQDEPAATAQHNAPKAAASNLPSLMARNATKSSSPKNLARPVAQVLNLVAPYADHSPVRDSDAQASPTWLAFGQMFRTLRSNLVRMWHKLEEWLGTPPPADNR